MEAQCGISPSLSFPLYVILLSLYFLASLKRQATAVMRAAPFPLPSSDWMRVTSQSGARSLKVSRMMVEKLMRQKRRAGVDEQQQNQLLSEFRVVFFPKNKAR